MSGGRRLSGRRRRSSNGLSLLPSEDNLCDQIPVGIPNEERALILTRKCYARTVSKLGQELDVPEDLLRALTIEGSAAFQDVDTDDILMKILRVATGARLTAEDMEKHHTRLRDLAAESKAWDELLQPGHFKFDLPSRLPDPADRAKMQSHYNMLTVNCARIVREGSLLVQDCEIAAKWSVASGLAKPAASASKPILGRCSEKPH